MANLSTSYLGLKLKNPVIISSSTLVQNLDGIKEAEAAGAGAIVLRSLFEELIREESGMSGKQMYGSHPEEYEYMVNELELQYGPNKYLELIKKAKAEVNIPIIASVNCISAKWWTNYARQIEAAGADALELNMSLMPSEPSKSSVDIEEEFIHILSAAKKEIKIPIAVKIGPYFTSLSRLANQLCGAGAGSLVLFNRFYQFDINIRTEKIVGANWYSLPHEMSQTLRWVSILYKHINGQIAANTGIHDGEAVIKNILAGAQVVEIASTVYLHGFSIIEKMLNDVNKWMDGNGYKSLADFRGKLSLSNQKDPEIYERLQYIKALTGIEKA